IVAGQVGVLVFWHLPFAYDAAVRNTVLHGIEHLSLLVSGLALWWIIVTGTWRDRAGLAILYLFLAGLPMGAIAALLALANHPLSTSQLPGRAQWGLTPIEDQQLAGAIMWVPGGIVYLAAASALFVRWLSSGPKPGEPVVRWDA